MPVVTKRPVTTDKPHSLLDRIAVGLTSGALSLVFGSLIWLALAPYGLGVIGVHSFWLVVIFASCIAALGFALATNVVADVVAWLARVFYNISR